VHRQARLLNGKTKWEGKVPIKGVDVNVHKLVPAWGAQARQ